MREDGAERCNLTMAKKASKAAKKTVKKAAAPKKAAKKAAPTTKTAAKSAPKKAAKKAAAKAAKKTSKKSGRAVSSPGAVAAARTPKKNARPPKAARGSKAAAQQEADTKRPAVVRPRSSSRAGALTGVKVVDLSTTLAGRAATLMLANFGAEVIKVVQPGSTEVSPETGEPQAAVDALNRGKRSLALNLRKNAGKEAFQKLVKTADVVLESGKPGRMDSLGLGYKSLKNQNKKLIYVSLSGYGQSGPYAGRVGADLNYMALTGLLDLLGTPDGLPTIPGLQVAETAGGALPTVIGTLLALAARERTGSGQLVDVAMYDGLLNLVNASLSEYAATRRAPQHGKEPLFGQYACYNLYPVRNGRWLSVAALEPEYWKNLCKAIGREDLLEDQFATGDRQQILVAELTRVFQKKEVSEWLEFFEGKDVCVAEVRKLGDTLHDEHLAAREMIVQIRGAGGAPPSVGVSPKLSATPGALGTDAPARGKDSRAILESLGYAQKKINDFFKSGAAEEPIES